MKPLKLRCKDVNIKRSHPIEPKKGKGSKYRREKQKDWKKEIQEGRRD